MRFMKAEDYYREALAYSPNDVELSNEVARFLISNDLDIVGGMALATKTVRQYPENSALMYTYGMALYKIGKLEESLEILKKSWDLEPYYDPEHHALIKNIEDSLARQYQ